MWLIVGNCAVRVSSLTKYMTFQKRNNSTRASYRQNQFTFLHWRKWCPCGVGSEWQLVVIHKLLSLIAVKYFSQQNTCSCSPKMNSTTCWRDHLIYHLTTGEESQSILANLLTTMRFVHLLLTHGCLRFLVNTLKLEVKIILIKLVLFLYKLWSHEPLKFFSTYSRSDEPNSEENHFNII